MRSATSEAEVRQLGSIAVDLLSEAHGRTATPDLAAALRRAIPLKLASLCRLGLRENGSGAGLSRAATDDLVRAERMEVAAELSTARRDQVVLSALGDRGIVPVVLKGRALAQRIWPRSWMRPAGDLDLLVDEAHLGLALSTLMRLGFRPCAGVPPGRFRPPVTEFGLDSPVGMVELHSHLFRSIGSGIPTRDVLERSRPAESAGVPIRILDRADELLSLLVHASVHGTVALKWMLDLHAAAMAWPREVWVAAAERAVASRTTRPFWAAAQLLSGSHTKDAHEVARRFEPAPPIRAMLRRLVVPSSAITMAPLPLPYVYALEAVLEERARTRIVRAAGLLERLLRTANRRLQPSGSERSRAEIASDRWIEGTWRNGDMHPAWLTLRGGSMSPTFREGDRILAAGFGAGGSSEVGDVVIVRQAGRLVAHRVVARSGTMVVTRGDARESDDPARPVSEILARVVAVAPRIGLEEVMHQ